MPDHCSQLSATILFSFSFGSSKDAVLFMSPNQNHIGPITEELLSDNSLRDKTLFHPFSKLNCVSHTHRPGVLDLFCASNVSWAISNLCFKNQTAFLSARVFFLTNISKLVSAALFPSKETACPSCFQSSCLFHEQGTLAVPLWLGSEFLPKDFCLNTLPCFACYKSPAWATLEKCSQKPCLS